MVLNLIADWSYNLEVLRADFYVHRYFGNFYNVYKYLYKTILYVSNFTNR